MYFIAAIFLRKDIAEKKTILFKILKFLCRVPTNTENIFVSTFLYDKL
jgi:hypothetical protein